jgi:hypothetical protein
LIERGAAPEHEHLGSHRRGRARGDGQHAARAVAAEPVDQPDELAARELAAQAWMVAHAAIFETSDQRGNFSAGSTAIPRPRFT